MKSVVILTIILFFSCFIQAQDDPKSKEILDKVTEKAKTFKTLSASFTFSMVNEEMEIDERNEGTIKLKGKKYVVELPEAGVTVYSDGQTVWNYMKQGNQVTISTIEEAGNELMDPSSLFSIYEKGFQSKYIGEKNVGGVGVYEIDLFPEEDIYDVSKITIEINKSTMMIQSAQLMGTDENVYGIVVKKMESNKEMPDSEFVFVESKYPDVEVIDLR
jgi:outer membrane lipoprotein-sorting protein